MILDQHQQHKIAVIIPAYNVENHIRDVVASIPSFVDQIIIVDDKSTDATLKVIQAINDSRLTIIHHEHNRGVGGAVLSGYDKAYELGADIFVKLDGDNQMDPTYIQALVHPIANLEADYTKGNRFLHIKELQRMPIIRRLGNLGLSFLTKLASGYWNIFDPTNGFTALHKEAYRELKKSTIAKDYFFESSMLIQLRRVDARVLDIPIPAKYEDEDSHLSPLRSLLSFPPRLFVGLIKRILYQYFLFNFTAVSLFLSTGIPAIIFGFIWGFIKWVESTRSGIPATTGTVLIAVLPIIVGVQLIVQAFSLDIDSVPERSMRADLFHLE